MIERPATLTAAVTHAPVERPPHRNDETFRCEKLFFFFFYVKTLRWKRDVFADRARSRPAGTDLSKSSHSPFKDKSARALPEHESPSIRWPMTDIASTPNGINYFLSRLITGHRTRPGKRGLFGRGEVKKGENWENG